MLQLYIRVLLARCSSHSPDGFARIPRTAVQCVLVVACISAAFASNLLMCRKALWHIGSCCRRCGATCRYRLRRVLQRGRAKTSRWRQAARTSGNNTTHKNKEGATTATTTYTQQQTTNTAATAQHNEGAATSNAICRERGVERQMRIPTARATTIALPKRKT